MQRYITYKRVKENEFKYNDPNTDWKFEEATNDSVFNESPYLLVDGRFVCDVIYPDNTTQEQIDWLIIANSSFEFTFITEEEANSLLSELWDVTVNNFIFTDNREIEVVWLV